MKRRMSMPKGKNGDKISSVFFGMKNNILAYIDKM